MKKLLLIFLPLLIITAGCAERPIVWMEKDAHLTAYKTFEVLPPLNETGTTFDDVEKMYGFKVMDEIHSQLKTQLKDKGFVVVQGTGSDQNVILVKSRLKTYTAGNVLLRYTTYGVWGSTRFILLTSLIDKKMGKILLEVVASHSVVGGGLLTTGAERWIIPVVVKSTADEIEEEMKSK